jgi:hypothetical protein
LDGLARVAGVLDICNGDKEGKFAHGFTFAVTVFAEKDPGRFDLGRAWPALS